MSKLDDLKRAEKMGKVSSVMVAAAGIIGAVAKGRKALNNDMNDALIKHEEDRYNNSSAIVKIFRGKPRK